MTDDVRIRVRVDDETGPGMRSATQGVDGGLGKIRESLGSLGPIAAGVGAAMAAGLAVAASAAVVLKKALDASIERSDIGAKIAAQLGDTDHAAEWGRLAGKVYADNFGDSLQDAGNAVRDVFRNKLIPEDAADDAIKAIAEKVLTVATIAESGSAEVSRSVRKMLVTGLAANAEEALDILTRGFQQGADEAGDLLDTFDEYSIQFKELGLNGKEALGLISQGLKGGARDADTVADALKELAIRAQDGSKASAEAFKGLGLDAQQLSSMFAAGGESARQALDMIVDKTKGITDPMVRNAVAVGLFGTKAEDLQDALFSLDLDSAAAGLGDVEGAANRASDALGKGLGPAIETLKRQAQQAFADLGDEIAPAVMGLIELWGRFASDVKAAFDGSEVPGELMEALRQLKDDYLPALKEGFNFLAGKVRENRGELEAVGHVLAEYVIPAFAFLLVNGVKAAVVVIGSLVDGFAMIVNAGTAVRNFAINLALTFLNAFDTIISGASKAFGWIPGIGPKLNAAAAEVHNFVQRVNNELKNIRDEDVYVRTHFVGGQGQSRGGDYATGGITGALSYAATGGVRGGLVKVGEGGSEFIRTPTGSMVYPHANTAQMETMAAQGGGGTGGVIGIRGDDEVGRLMVRLVAEAMRGMGGRASDLGIA
jgi:hypothetical protein